MDTTTGQQAETYQTDKLPFAAYLVLSGKSKVTQAKSNGPKRNVTFIMSPVPCDKDIASYFTGDAVVSANRFIEAMNELKRMAYEVRRNG